MRKSIGCGPRHAFSKLYARGLGHSFVQTLLHIGP